MGSFFVSFVFFFFLGGGGVFNNGIVLCPVGKCLRKVACLPGKSTFPRQQVFPVQCSVYYIRECYEQLEGQFIMLMGLKHLPLY